VKAQRQVVDEASMHAGERFSSSTSRDGRAMLGVPPERLSDGDTDGGISSLVRTDVAQHDDGGNELLRPLVDLGLRRLAVEHSVGSTDRCFERLDPADRRDHVSSPGLANRNVDDT
jgi:hypothetical protein